MIALGVVAAVWLFGRRLEETGIGTRDDAASIAVWAVLAGVIGARLYHVITDWERFEDDLGDIPKIWEGGLGIPGGLIAGIPVGIWVAHRRGLPIGEVATCAAPAIAARPGDRAMGQLVQPGAVRPPDRPAVGARDRRRAPPARLRPGHDVPPDVPLRVAVEPRALRRAAVDRPALQPGARPADGGVRRRLRHRPVLGRGLRIDKADELAGLRWNQWMALAGHRRRGSSYLCASRGEP